MKVSVDAQPFATEQQIMARYGREGVAIAKRHVKASSFGVERRIKIRMPVDTGRARASWGHSTPPASPADGIWEESNGGMTITQGSRVEYMEALNEGHSKQAPAGFIDVEAERAADELMNNILADLVRAFG